MEGGVKCQWEQVPFNHCKLTNKYQENIFFLSLLPTPKCSSLNEKEYNIFQLASCFQSLLLNERESYRSFYNVFNGRLVNSPFLLQKVAHFQSLQAGKWLYKVTSPMIEAIAKIMIHTVYSQKLCMEIN